LLVPDENKICNVTLGT